MSYLCEEKFIEKITLVLRIVRPIVKGIVGYTVVVATKVRPLAGAQTSLNTERV